MHHGFSLRMFTLWLLVPLYTTIPWKITAIEKLSLRNVAPAALGAKEIESDRGGRVFLVL